MTQIILNGISLPETTHGKYQCYPAELGAKIDMISGRRVTEVRGHVYYAQYQYDYFTDAMWRQIAATLRSGESFTATVLPDDSSDMYTGVFSCDSITNPTFAFSRHGTAYWYGINFTIREVRPHD